MTDPFAAPLIEGVNQLREPFNRYGVCRYCWAYAYCFQGIQHSENTDAQTVLALCPAPVIRCEASEFTYKTGIAKAVNWRLRHPVLQAQHHKRLQSGRCAFSLLRALGQSRIAVVKMVHLCKGA